MMVRVGVLIALLLIVPAIASAQPTISIESAQYQQQPPFTFKLPVYASNVENATGVNFNLTFDPNILNVVSVSANETFPNLSIWANINNDTGFANIAVVAEDPITITDPKPLVDIEFRAVNYGYTHLNFTFAELSLPDFNTTNVLVKNGSVFVLLPLFPTKLTCAGFCHAKYVELSTDFVPNTPISFNQSNVILGIFKEYGKISWTIQNPVIELFYNTSELYPPHTRGSGSFDMFDPTPAIVNNVTGYVKWNLPDVTTNHTAAIARAFDEANFGLILDKPEMEVFRNSQDVITTNGRYWTNVTVNATDCFRVSIVVKLMNNTYMDANVVSWSTVTPPDVHARIDKLDNKTLVAIFERPGIGWNPTNGTIRLNVSYDIMKFTSDTIFYKPEVKVAIRKRVASDWLNRTIYNNSYNVSLRSVLFDRWANFSSSSKLNWTTEEFDARVIRLKGQFSVGGKPDLIVIGKDEIDVQGGYKVQYIIKNIGNATAPSGHKTALIVDGKLIETKEVPVSLSPGATFSDTFNTTIPFTSPPNDTITVVADYSNDVDELNESNNSKTNVYEYPQIALIKIESGFAPNNKTTIVNITVENVEDLANFNINVTYDPSVVIVTAATNNPAFGTPLNNLEHASEGYVRLGTLNLGQGVSGSTWLSKLTLKAVGNPGDTTYLNLTVEEFFNSNEENIPFTVQNGTFTVGLPKTGDMNGDGKVSLKDAVYLGKHVMGFSGYEELYADGDVNSDGKVSLKDAVYLGKHVMGFSGYEELYPGGVRVK